MLGRHDEADELPASDQGNVDSVHAAPPVQRGPARHAAVDRAGVVDALLDAVLDQPVRDTLGDGQAEVQRESDRPGAFALCGNLGAQLQGRQLEVVGRDHGEVVAYVNGEDVQEPGAPVARQVFQTVLLRVQHGLRHDVVIRHDAAPVFDGETAPVERARVGAMEEAANLHHGIARRVEPDFRIVRELLARDVGLDGSGVDRGLINRGVIVRGCVVRASCSLGLRFRRRLGLRLRLVPEDLLPVQRRRIADPHSHSATTSRATFNRGSYMADEPVKAVYPSVGVSFRARSAPCPSWS